MYELTDIEIDQVAGGNVVANGNAQAGPATINGVPVNSTSTFNATGVNLAGSAAGSIVVGGFTGAGAGGFAFP